MHWRPAANLWAVLTLVPMLPSNTNQWTMPQARFFLLFFPFLSLSFGSLFSLLESMYIYI